MVEEEKIQGVAELNVRNDEQEHNWRPHTSARRSSFHLQKWIYIFYIFKACAIVYISCLKKDKTERCSNFSLWWTNDAIFELPYVL